MPVCESTRALLEVRELTVCYDEARDARPSVRNLSFDIRSGEILGMQGRSGCGKTTTALALLKLLPDTARVTGLARFRGKDLLRLTKSELRPILGHEISIIHQEPVLALNPVMRIGDQIAEVLRAHTKLSARECRQRAAQMLGRVSLDASAHYDAYSHELSGGERHRVVLAQALVCEPVLVIADEPTAGLDPKLIDEILDLINRLREETGTAFLLISHDYKIASRLADRTISLTPGDNVTISATSSYGEVRTGHTVSAPRTEPLMSVRNLSKSYSARGLFRRKQAEKRALHSIDLDIAAGSLIGLVGPSGSGKSTLARCLALLERADAGAIHFDKKNLLVLGASEARALRPRLQYVPQDPAAALNPRLSAEEAIIEPLVIQRRGSTRERRLESELLMRQVGLDPATRNRSCSQFSGGQKQRLAIARALALKPSLLIFDESLSGLDWRTQEEILEIIRDLKALGITQLLISHDLEMVSRVADSVAVMQNGRIVEHEPTSATCGAFHCVAKYASHSVQPLELLATEAE